MKKTGLVTYLAVTICVGLCISGCTSNKIMEIDDTVQQVEESEDIEEVKAEDKAPILLTNYIQQPKTAFDVYDKAQPIKGIYVSAFRAGGVRSDGTKFIDDVMQLVEDTEVNAMVIDVKDDTGVLTFKNKMPYMDENELSRNYIPNIDDFMQRILDAGVYPIARIVTFKDNTMAELRPELMVQSGEGDGQVYRDNANNAWLNPYKKENWEYIIEIAKCAASLGFKEIQFDYIRFVADAKLNEDNLGDTEGVSKEEIITAFAQYAVDQMRPLGVKVSADVYGTVIGSAVDQAIVGQNYVELSKVLDVICPMVYPSHYAAGEFGAKYPDLEPYKIIFESMKMSSQKLEEIPESEHKAIVRPWLQDFTATYLRQNYQVYEGQQRKEQIDAVYSAGGEEWLLWDPSVMYTEEGIY